MLTWRVIACIALEAVRALETAVLNTREVSIAAWYVARVRDLTLSIVAGTIGDV